MATNFDVVQDRESGEWQVRGDKETLETYKRLEDAVAHARAALLQSNKGSIVVYTPSGRPREKLDLKEEEGHKTVQLA